MRGIKVDREVDPPNWFIKLNYRKVMILSKDINSLNCKRVQLIH